MEAMELQKGEEECEAKVRKYNRRLRICEPSSFTPSALREMREEMHDELFMALSEMINSIESFVIKHEQELSSHVVAVWKQRITDAQGEFINFLNMVSSKLDPPQDCAPDVPEDRTLPLRRFLDSLDQQILSDCLTPPRQGGGVLEPYGNLPTSPTNPTPALAPASGTTPALTSALYSKDEEDEEEASDHEITHFEASDHGITHDDAAKEETSDEFTHNGATKDEFAVSTTNHAPAAVESMGGVREDQDGCRGRDWMLLMSILRKFRTGSRPQMSFMNLWGGASRMTLRLAPTPLLLLQLMEFLQVAAKVTVMYEEERKVSYTHKSVLLGGARVSCAQDGCQAGRVLRCLLRCTLLRGALGHAFRHGSHCPEDQLRPEGGGGHSVAWVQY